MSRPEPDEEYGRHLMGRLAAEPDAPSRVDLSRAVAVGRRRRRIRRVGTAAAAATVTALTVVAAPSVLGAFDGGPDRRDTADTTPAPQPSTTTMSTGCQPGWLPLPAGDGEEAVVSAGDPTGRWHAGRYRATDGDGNYDLLIWHDGGLVPTAGGFPGADQTISDINASGTAVGWTLDEQRHRPYAYVVGKAVKLPGVTEGQAIAVNDAGTIVGSRTVRNDYPVPVRWDSAAQAAVNLPLPAGYDTGEALDIDEDGTVVGSISPANRRRQPYLWRADGTGELLPLPTIGGEPASEFNPAGIRAGWVVGDAVAAATSTGLPYRYHTVTRRFERLADREMIINAVNGRGWAVGYVFGERTEAVLLAGTREVPLPTDVLGPGGGATRAMAVSDDGRSVAGDGLTYQDVSRPILWRCD